MKITRRVRHISKRQISAIAVSGYTASVCGLFPEGKKFKKPTLIIYCSSNSPASSISDYLILHVKDCPSKILTK